MSTAGSTGSSISGSKRNFASLGYTPGESIFKRITTRARREALRRARHGPTAYPVDRFPQELIELLLAPMVAKNDALSVMKLMMVSRGFRDYIRGHWEVWMAFYQMRSRMYFRFTMQNTPNFMRRQIPHWLVQELRRRPETPEREAELLCFVRRLVVLHHSRRCGLCGSARYKVVPYWSLGTCLCTYCVQDNLISDVELYERYFLSLNGAFAKAVRGRALFFWMASTPRQRLALTLNPVNYRGPPGPAASFYFWKPHLERLLDLPALAEEAARKSAAAATVRAHVRRSLVMTKAIRLRGYTLRDKRPMHARLVLAELTRVPCTVRSVMFDPATMKNEFNALFAFQDYVHDPVMDSLARGQARI